MMRKAHALHATPRPNKYGRDRAYDAGYQRVGGSTVNALTVEGMEYRSAGGPRRCYCGRWVEVRDLNAHYKEHRDGERPRVMELED